MSLLLTHTNFYTSTGKTATSPPLPLDVIRMSTFLQQSKIFHEVVDPTFNGFENLVKIDFTKFKFIAVNTGENTFKNTLRFIQSVRSIESNKAITIIIYGKNLKGFTENLIQAGADMVILEHSFQTLVDLINTLNTPFNPFLDGVPDIAFKNYFGKVFFTEPRKENISTRFILPDYSKIDLLKYINTGNKKNSSTTYPFNLHRTYQPQDVAGEIEAIRKVAGNLKFRFTDWNLAVNRPWIHSFLGELQNKHVSISFECCCKATDLDDGLLQLLKNTGCNKLWILAEGDEAGLEELIVKSKNFGIKTGLVIDADDEIPYDKLIETVAKSSPHSIAVAEPDSTKNTTMFEEFSTGFSGMNDKKEFYKNVKDYILNESKVKYASKWQKRLNPNLWIHASKASSAKNKLGIKQPMETEQV